QLVAEAELGEKAQILTGLYRVQHVEDPVPFLRILETDFSNEEKLAHVLQHLTELDSIQLVAVIETVSDASLKSMEDYLELLDQRQNSDTEPEGRVPKALLENLRDFFQYFGR